MNGISSTAALKAVVLPSIWMESSAFELNVTTPALDPAGLMPKEAAQMSILSQDFIRINKVYLILI